MLQAYRQAAEQIADPGDKFDKGILDELTRITPDRLDVAADSIWDLNRGYRDADIRQKSAELDLERRKQLEIASRLISRTRSLIAMKTTGHRPHRAKILNQNLMQLLSLRDELKLVDPKREAKRHLLERRWNRLTGGYAFELMTAEWDAARRSVRLHWLNPEKLDFPLRFLVHQPSGLYHKLEDEWRAGATKNELLKNLAVYALDSKVAESIVSDARGTVIAREPWRIAALEELREAITAGRMLAAGLIAVTQCEGIVWFYAKHLSNTGIHVVKPLRTNSGKMKYGLYDWDQTKNDYTTKAKNGRPRLKVGKGGKPVLLTSGREVVQLTRFQQILPIELWDYLLSGFFDDRNDLTHGNRPMSDEDVAAALLCLNELIQTVRNFEAQRLHRASQAP